MQLIKIGKSLRNIGKLLTMYITLPIMAICLLYSIGYIINKNN